MWWRLYRWRLSPRDELVQSQQQQLAEATQMIIDLQIITLESYRKCRDLAIGFRISLESPEIDIREDLDELIDDLSNAVACIEEQVVT